MSRNTKSGIILSYLVAVSPVIMTLAWGSRPADQSLATLLDSLGRIAGIMGFSLYAWNLILSARIGWLERQFGGLDKLYKIHHIVGGLAFILLLIHPTLITLRYALLSLVSAYEILLPSLADIPLQAGKLALSGLVVVLFVTFYVWVSHERFMWIHRLTGVLFAIAAYHAFFVTGSRILQVPVLAWYLASLAATALGLFAYRFVFKSLKPRRRYRVSAIEDLGGAWELTLTPTARGIEHQAGQFAFLTFVNPDLPQQTHPFTIASAPSEQALRFTIKNLGDFTKQLSKLKVGDKAFVEGAYGTFNYANMPRKQQVWVAGGIGITPFLSMARTLRSSDGVEAHLFYSVADTSQAYYANELRAIANELTPTMHFTLHDSSTQGYLTAELIAKQVPNIAECDVLLCGPKGMMHALEAQFVSVGVSKSHIQYEEFSLL